MRLPPIYALLALFFPIAGNAQQITEQRLDAPCIYCNAYISQGGGIYGHTASLMSLHVISSKYDVAFPRALVLKLETDCEFCQPAALQAHVRGTANTSPFAANFECYSEGRCTGNEINIGARHGGYALDIIPVRLPDGSPSRVDAIMKIEGFGFDKGAADIDRIIDIRINPRIAVIVIPADQGPITVMQTADGRMKEVWEKTEFTWTRYYIIDGVRQP